MELKIFNTINKTIIFLIYCLNNFNYNIIPKITLRIFNIYMMFSTFLPFAKNGYHQKFQTPPSVKTI